MFVKRRRNLNFNNNDSFLDLNYDKPPAPLDMNGNSIGEVCGEIKEQKEWPSDLITP